MTVNQYLELITKYGINMLHIPTEEQLKNVSIDEAEKALTNLCNVFNGTK